MERTSAHLQITFTATAVLSQRAYILSQRNKTILAIFGCAILATLVLGINHATFGVQADANAMIDGKGACLPCALFRSMQICANRSIP